MEAAGDNKPPLSTVSGRPRSRYYMMKMKQLEQQRSNGIKTSPMEERSGDQIPRNILIDAADMAKLENQAKKAVDSDGQHQKKSSEQVNEIGNTLAQVFPEDSRDDSHPAASATCSMDSINHRETSQEKEDVEAAVPNGSVLKGLENLPIEEDKLAWIIQQQQKADECQVSSQNDISNQKNHKSNEPFEARFDSNGMILAPGDKAQSTAGLHHHGQDSEKPGYTLDEIFILLQSANQAQKIWALGIFTAIIRQAKASAYDDYLAESLLTKMVEADMILPLRHLLDDRALPVISAALVALKALLVNETDEDVTDCMLAWDDYPTLFELKPTEQLDEETEEASLTDAQLISMDLIKGLLRTDLLVRFQYILTALHDVIDNIPLAAIFHILIRIVRLSEATATLVAQNQTLMDLLMSVEMTEKCPIEQMKLLRVICQILGPVNYSWAGGIIHQTAAWIAALRNEIRSVVIRDMITESLNLLIVLAHHKEVPGSFTSIMDVFPQLLFSASPKPTYSPTKWDAMTCSRVLMLLTLCRSMYSNAHFKVYIEKIVPVVLDGLSYTEASHSAPEPLLQLKAAYLRFLTTLVHFETPSNSFVTDHLPQLLVADICQKFNLKPLIPDVFHVSPSDPDCLPSYGLVLRGGEAFHPVIAEIVQLDLWLNVFRFLDAVNVPLMTPEFGKKLEETLEVIANFNGKRLDFWTSRLIRLISTVIMVSLKVVQVYGNVLQRNLLYSAAVNIAALLEQHQDTELKAMLIEILFGCDFIREIPGLDLVPSNEVYMRTTHQAFHNLRLMGFTGEKNLLLDTRDCTVFERTWMFTCLSYIAQFASAVDKTRANDFLRGYFSWLPLLVEQSSNLGFTEQYVAMIEVFDDGTGYYRDPFISDKLKMVIQHLAALIKSPKSVNPAAKCDKRPVADIYVDLLENFSATSYGDAIFTSFILLPVNQAGHERFRLTLWGPEKQIPSLIRIHHQDLAFDVRKLLNPPETNVALLRQYFTMLLTKTVSETRNPLMYLIAVSHLHHLLKRKAASEDERKLRERLVQFIETNLQAVLVQHIVRYDGPSHSKSFAVRLVSDDASPKEILQKLTNQ